MVGCEQPERHSIPSDLREPQVESIVVDLMEKNQLLLKAPVTNYCFSPGILSDCGPVTHLMMTPMCVS